MCKPFSCIITKNQTVYTHPNPLIHSHTEIMNHYNLKESNKDPIFNSFVKIEACPKNNKSYLTTPVDEWDIKVDEDYIPSWYEDDKESFETIIRKAAISWLNKIKEIDWIKATPKDCYRFVLDFLKEPFQPCEKVIATDARYSYLYAIYILKGPFPLGEQAIATNDGYSYMYAVNILKGPFPLGEKIISTDTYYSYDYALDILKGPFPLGEKIIADNVYYSYLYAKDILKGRFKLGEKAIATNPYYNEIYHKLILNNYLLSKQNIDTINIYLKKSKKRTIKENSIYICDLLSYMTLNKVCEFIKGMKNV